MHGSEGLHPEFGDRAGRLRPGIGRFDFTDARSTLPCTSCNIVALVIMIEHYTNQA